MAKHWVTLAVIGLLGLLAATELSSWQISQGSEGVPHAPRASRSVANFESPQHVDRVSAAGQRPSRHDLPETSDARTAQDRSRQRARKRARSDREDAPPAGVVVSSEEQLAAIRTHLGERVGGEHPDPAWAGRAQAEIVRHVAEDQLLIGGTLLRASCRTTLCEIVFSFPDEASRDESLELLTLPWNGQAFYYADESDPLKVVVYAAREGYGIGGAG